MIYLPNHHIHQRITRSYQPSQTNNHIQSSPSNHQSIQSNQQQPNLYSLPSKPKNKYNFSVEQSINRTVEKYEIDGSWENDYLEYRKSYRKFQKKVKGYISYRKYQNPLEVKIFTIINKLISGRVCRKDLIQLNQKINKINGKEIINKYIVSGFKVICQLVKCSHLYQESLVLQLTNKIPILNNIIQLQLDDDTQYTQFNLTVPLNHKLLQLYLIRKIYSILKSKKYLSTIKLKDYAVEIYQQLLDHDNLDAEVILTMLQSIQNQQSELD